MLNIYAMLFECYLFACNDWLDMTRGSFLLFHKDVYENGVLTKSLNLTNIGSNTRLLHFKNAKRIMWFYMKRNAVTSIIYRNPVCSRINIQLIEIKFNFLYKNNKNEYILYHFYKYFYTFATLKLIYIRINIFRLIPKYRHQKNILDNKHIVDNIWFLQIAECSILNDLGKYLKKYERYEICFIQKFFFLL